MRLVDIVNLESSLHRFFDMSKLSCIGAVQPRYIFQSNSPARGRIAGAIGRFGLSIIELGAADMFFLNLVRVYWRGKQVRLLYVNAVVVSLCPAQCL